MGRFTGRTAVVTGGGRGIGRSIALGLAREGANVVISSRTEAELAAVVTELEATGARATFVVADATDRASAITPVEAAVERFGAVDILVNNAGGTLGGGHDPFASTPDQDGFERTLVLCLTSPWWTSVAALPGMRERGWGRIINIGSGAAKTSGGSAAYTAAKHGLVGLTKQLAVATGELGITVNCLCPGWTQTALLDWNKVATGRGTSVEEARQWAAQQSVQNRILDPDELTDMAVLLASDSGRGITGQVISVDGGYKV